MILAFLRQERVVLAATQKNTASILQKSQDNLLIGNKIGALRQV
jgi:hypothetical protein